MSKLSLKFLLGVFFTLTAVNTHVYASNYSEWSDYKLCYGAKWDTGAKLFTKKFDGFEEIKIRGLNCIYGTREENTNGHLPNCSDVTTGRCFAIETWSDATEDAEYQWIGEHIAKAGFSLPTREMGIKTKNGKIIWEGSESTNMSYKTPYSSPPYFYSTLNLSFNALSLEMRKKVQQILYSFGFYKSNIDGLYGNNTGTALKAYNKVYLDSSDLTKQSNVRALLSHILELNQKSIQDTDIADKDDDEKIVPKDNPKPSNDEIFNVASGTGFFVSNSGHIITNHHVIEGCNEIETYQEGGTVRTVIIAEDRLNDLAILKSEIKPDFVFPLAGSNPFALQEIIVAGYPFGEVFSSTIKFTKGIVSSLAGIGNNYSEIQIDAAIQPGNSGGPIVDERGNVIGVAVAKLALEAVLEDFGVVPENTNFGIKVSAVKNLLEGNNINFLSPNEEKVPISELSKSISSGTVYLTCWMDREKINEMVKKKVLFQKYEN